MGNNYLNKINLIRKMIHPTPTVVKQKPKPSILQNAHVQNFMDNQDMYGS